LIRRIEDGEEITITVAGRVAARLVPGGDAYLAAMDRDSRTLHRAG